MRSRPSSGPRYVGPGNGKGVFVPLHHCAAVFPDGIQQVTSIAAFCTQMRNSECAQNLAPREVNRVDTEVWAAPLMPTYNSSGT